LPIALADDPEAAWLKFGKKYQGLAEKLREIDPEGFREVQEIAASNMKKTEPFQSLIQQFVQTEDWLTSKQIIESHPEILSDEAIYLLEQLIMSHYAQGDPIAAHLLGRRLELLRRCREKGVIQAFSEETGLHFIDVVKANFMHESPIVQPPPAVQEVLTMMTHEFTANNTDAVLLGGVSEKQLEHFWDSRPDLVQKLREAERLSFDAAITSELQALLDELAQPINPLEMPHRIQLCEKALAMLPRQQHPQLWAMLQKELGVCLSDNLLGDPAENIERSIIALHDAMQVFTQRAAPDEWADALYNLGIAYLKRIRADRAANIEQAIKSFQQALEVITRTGRPVEWSRTMTELGHACLERIQGDREENIERAIENYAQALQVRTREEMPVEWARTTCGLAGAYLKRIRGDRAKNIEQAIEAYEQALTGLSPQKMPVEWALTQRNLGIAYQDRVQGDKAENIEQAIEACVQALTVLSRQAMPVEWAGTMNNLAILYKNRVTGDKATNIERAISAYQQALEVFRPDSSPYHCRQIAANLGILHVERHDWRSAYTAYALAIQATEAIYRDTFVPLNQQAEIKVSAPLYDSIIASSARLRDDQQYARQGLVYAEAARARTFLSQMGQADFPPPPDAPADLMAREHELLLLLRRMEQAVAIDRHSNDLSPRTNMEETNFQTTFDEQIRGALAWQKVKQHKSLRDELERIWETLSREHPHTQDYVALRRAHTPTWDDLARLASRLGSEAAMVEFYAYQEEIVAFVLQEGWSEPQIVILPLSHRRLLHRYFLPYHDEVLDRENLTRSNRRPTHSWLTLGKELLEPLESALGNAKLVYLIPHGLLHLMPLHALTVHGAPFIARRAVVYAPSAAVLTRTLERTQPQDKSTRPLVLGYTASSDPVERALFLNEAREIATYFACSPVIDAAANIGILLKYAPTASRIHLSCHGRFNRDDPLVSGVDLADGTFSARDWMGLQLRADLVTLSACETGFSDVGQGDEIVGLMRALLYAGASSALLALWSVTAATTLEWMLDFYRLVGSNTIDKQSKALAFQQATIASYERYPDPYYWAAFVLVGNWR
jgi:CHAT domain-containing protein